MVGPLQEWCNSSFVNLRGTSKSYIKKDGTVNFEFYFRVLCAPAAL